MGALSLLGSPVVDSAHTCPCLCLDTISSSSMNLKSGGDVRFRRQSLGKRQYRQIGSLELSKSFVGSGKESLRVVNRGLRMQRKVHRSMIVNELGGQYEDTFKDVKMQLLNYFTYKAVRTVLNQLHENNPPQHTWLYNFVATNEPGDGKLFIRNLGKEKHDLAERVMATRLHLYGKWVKKCNHAEIYQEMSDENLELMRERLMETVIWPSDDTNTEKVG